MPLKAQTTTSKEQTITAVSELLSLCSDRKGWAVLLPEGLAVVEVDFGRAGAERFGPVRKDRLDKIHLWVGYS